MRYSWQEETVIEEEKLGEFRESFGLRRSYKGQVEGLGGSEETQAGLGRRLVRVKGMDAGRW